MSRLHFFQCVLAIFTSETFESSSVITQLGSRSEKSESQPQALVLSCSCAPKKTRLPPSHGNEGLKVISVCHHEVYTAFSHLRLHPTAISLNTHPQHHWTVCQYQCQTRLRDPAHSRAFGVKTSARVNAPLDSVEVWKDGQVCQIHLHQTS